MRKASTASRSVTTGVMAFGAFVTLASTSVHARTTMAAESPSGAFICFGEGFAFSTESTHGWTLDQEAGRSDGLCVVGYPMPDDAAPALTAPFKESPVVLFATVTPRFRDGHLLTYEEVQAMAAERFRASKPNLEIRDGDPIQVDGKKVIVRKFFPHPVGEQTTPDLSWDTFAFIEEPQHVVTLVLSARSRESHDKFYQSFRGYVRTYKSITKLSRH